MEYAVTRSCRLLNGAQILNDGWGETANTPFPGSLVLEDERDHAKLGFSHVRQSRTRLQYKNPKMPESRSNPDTIRANGEKS